MIWIDSDGGRIGPLWWVNADTTRSELFGAVGLASDPSRHYVWRPGVCGWGPAASARFTWKIIHA